MANGIRLSTLRARIKRDSVVYTPDELRFAWERCPAIGDVTPHTLDREEYVALPKAAWDMVLVHLGIGKYDYRSDRSDCDDFAFAVRGRAPLELQVNGVGAVLDCSAGHGYNALLIAGSTPSIEFIEPQGDTPDEWWVKRPGEDGLYDLDCGAVIF